MNLIWIVVSILFFGISCFFLFLLWKKSKNDSEVMELKNHLTEITTSKNALQQQYEAERALLKENFEQEKNTLHQHEEEMLRHREELYTAEKANLEKKYEMEKSTLLQQKDSAISAKDKEIFLLHEQYEEKLKNQKELSDSEIEALKSAFTSEKKTLLQTLEDVKAQFAHSMAEMEKDRQNRLSLMKEEFKTLSNSILEEKSGKLNDVNKQQMEALLNPLSEKMGEFKKAVEESKTKGIELNTALNVQLSKMMEETNRIGGEARELVNALRGQQKTQGDWGELILEEILRKSGLQKDVHYECQVVIKDVSGKIVRNNENEQFMRPDVIVHYPDGKDVIIDSKVSLTAYTDYMNAENEAVRNEACQRHIKSIKAHIDELIRKDYSAYWAKSGRETVDFVIMFIPNEGPFHLAMISEPAIWTEAFRKKVLIVSPVNLMALLKIIHIAWSRDEQNRNQQAILDTATELLDRLHQFYEAFDGIGDAINKISEKYEEATRKLKEGNRNRSVVMSGEKLKKLGVRMTKSKNVPERLQTVCESDNLFCDDANKLISAEQNTL